jgi:hypothetical protein
VGFTEAIGVALDREDIGVVDDAVDQRGGIGGERALLSEALPELASARR